MDGKESQNVYLMSLVDQLWIIAQNIRKSIEVYDITGTGELTRVNSDSRDGVAGIGGRKSNSNHLNLGVIVTCMKKPQEKIVPDINTQTKTLITDVGQCINMADNLNRFNMSIIADTDMIELLLNDWKMHLKMQNLTKNN